MTTVEEWIILTDKKLLNEDIEIPEEYLGILDINEIKDWIIYENDVNDYYNYYPIKTGANGVRFWCDYININKKHEEFGKLFRLTSFVGGGIDFIKI